MLGLDFLTKYDPEIKLKKRCMFVNVVCKRRCIKAYKAPDIPVLQSNLIRLCHVDTFANECTSDMDFHSYAVLCPKK